MYNFGLDAGGENIGLLNRVRGALKDCVWVMFAAVFCVLHQAHLIGKALIQAVLVDMKPPLNKTLIDLLA